MRRTAERWAVAISSVTGLGLGCAVSFGDYEVGPSDAAADGTSSGGWPNVDAGECACAPAAPGGWLGPTVLTTGDSDVAVDCPPGFEAQTPDLHQDLMLECEGCSCTPRCGHDLEFFDLDTCSSPLGPNDATETCTTGSLPSVTGVQVKSTLTCMPSPEQPAAIAPRWATLAKRCAPQAASCPGGPTCMRSPAYGDICIHTEGDVACPAGSDYSHKRLFFGGIDGTHACTPCTCVDGNASPADCGPVRFFSSGCTQEGFTCDPDTDCCVPPASPAKVDGWIAEPAEDNHCQPLGGAPAPGSEPARTLPTTLCCLSLD